MVLMVTRTKDLRVLHRIGGGMSGVTISTSSFGCYHPMPAWHCKLIYDFAVLFLNSWILVLNIYNNLS